MNALPSQAEFAACLHSNFQVMDEPPPQFNLVLVSVSDLQKTAWQQNFSIVFHGPSVHFLPQRIYKLNHERLGELDLFLVPVRQQAETMLYEAVFNYLIEDQS